MQERLQQQVEYLEKRGIIFSNRKKAVEDLKQVSLYKLRRYFINFKGVDGKIDLSGVDFQEIMNQYLFDKELKKILLDVLYDIEQSLKNIIILFIGEDIYNRNIYNEDIADDRLDYLKKRCDDLMIYDEECKVVSQDVEHISSELFINKLTFGEIYKVFYSLVLDKREYIASSFGMSISVFQNWIKVGVYLRNICSHQENVFNKNMVIHIYGRRIVNVVGKGNRFSSYLCIILIFEKLLGIKKSDKIFHYLKKYNIQPECLGIKKETFPFELTSEAWKVLVEPLYDFYIKKSSFFEKKKIILAFETSCDDTSIAIFEDEKLLVMETASQIKIHNITGGVVPEVAAREHANAIFDVLNTVLTESNITLEQIDYIGVTTNPGLLPSLLTGTTVASTLSTVLQIPIIPINHIQAHIFANFLEREEKEIKFPLVCLTVSGGHNDMYYMQDMWGLEKVGSTTDDASGEAFDKVAKMMGLEYPGGPIVSQLAEEHRPFPTMGEISTKPLFPRVWLVKKEANFSFSGLKSAVKREVDRRIAENGELSLNDKREMSYEFQEAVIEVLAYKLIQVALQKGVKTVLLAGGVSANTRLKEEITKLSNENNLKFLYPVKNVYSMDNAAMVGILTYYRVKYGEFEKKIGVVKV